MNIISRIGCRCFQLVLRLALPILPYRKPRILNRVDQIPGVLKERKIASVMVVTDGHLHLSGMLEPLKTALREQGIGYTVYDEVVPNPTVLNVELARERYLKEGCQALIGFGGGSAIDCAKAVGARIARPRKSIARMKGILQVMRPIPFLIAVPTTAGTGSETTLATVITDEKTGHKFPINDFPLIPRVAVLDPEMTRSLPRNLTATTGMDALTHAIEAYIGGSTTAGTRRDALRAAALIADNLEAAWENGDDMEARRNMLTAAFYAGAAFSKSYVGYCHAVAHSLGGRYHIPHGLANAVLLPYVLERYGSAIHPKARDIAMAMGLASDDTPAGEATAALIGWIREKNVKMGIPEKLDGIRPEDIPMMARRAHTEANPLYPVPVLMDQRELEQFYHAVRKTEPTVDKRIRLD